MSKTLLEKQVKTRVKGEVRKKTQQHSTLNKEGEELLDERPLFHDAGFKKPETMNDKIRRITQQVQAETVAKLTSQNLSDEDMLRILDEEDDFDIPEDYDNTMTLYEAQGALSDLKEDVHLTIDKQSEATGGEATAKQTDVPIQSDGEAVTNTEK